MAQEDLYLHGIYQHYKGNEYEILGSALCSETNIPYVVYRDNDTGYQWIRKMDEFQESVTLENGDTVPRFKLVGFFDARIFIKK